jgi:hypothetical protein
MDEPIPWVPWVLESSRVDRVAKEKHTGITEVLGSSMCSLSQAGALGEPWGSGAWGIGRSVQVHMLRSKYPEALKVAEEASQLFKSNGFMRNQVQPGVFPWTDLFEGRRLIHGIMFPYCTLATKTFRSVFGRNHPAFGFGSCS